MGRVKKALCIAPGCNKLQQSTKFCNFHYSRARQDAGDIHVVRFTLRREKWITALDLASADNHAANYKHGDIARLFKRLLDEEARRKAVSSIIGDGEKS